jgi:hypothetical protein
VISSLPCVILHPIPDQRYVAAVVVVVVVRDGDKETRCHHAWVVFEVGFTCVYTRRSDGLSGLLWTEINQEEEQR